MPDPCTGEWTRGYEDATTDVGMIARSRREAFKNRPDHMTITYRGRTADVDAEPGTGYQWDAHINDIDAPWPMAAATDFPDAHSAMVFAVGAFMQSIDDEHEEGEGADASVQPR